MPPQFAYVVTSRDGRSALLAQYDGNGFESVSHAARCLGFTITEGGRAPRRKLDFHFNHKPADPAYGLGLPSDPIDALQVLARARLGDAIDDETVPPHSGDSIPHLPCLTAWIVSIGEREPASDADLWQYIAAKVFWAHKIGDGRAVFYHEDRLRLGASFDALWHVAFGGSDHYWKLEGQRLSDGFVLRAFPPLIREFRSGANFRVGGSTLLDVGPIMADDRYAASRRALEKAIRYYRQAVPDYENAAKEAVSAVESAARTIAGGSSLSDALPRIRTEFGLHPQIMAALTNLWSLASDSPNVRHGSPVNRPLTPSEAQLMVNWSSAALLLLVELDRARWGAPANRGNI